MKFGFAGDLSELSFVIQTLCAAENTHVTCGSVSDGVAASLAQSGIQYNRVGSSEEAALDSETEILVVGSSNVDESINICRQASQAGKHVLVIPPNEATLAFSFELHLLLDESKNGIIVLSGRWYSQPSDQPVNTASCQQVRLTCSLPATSQLLTRSQVYAIDALYGLGVDFNRLTAIDTKAAEDTLISRTITLAGTDDSSGSIPPATLTFAASATDSEDACRIELIHADGTKDTVGFDEPTNNDVNSSSLFSKNADALLRTLENSDECQKLMTSFSKTLEALSAVDRSLKRRRTIDIHFDGVSERSVFKSQMTAMGCGVLTYVAFGMVAYLVLAQVADLPGWALNTVRAVWIAPVVLFLLAQLLLPIARERTLTSDGDD